MQAALEVFCKESFTDLKEAEKEACFSSHLLDVNEVFCLTDWACLGVFAPDSAPPPPPPQPEERYDGPSLADRFLQKIS